MYKVVELVRTGEGNSPFFTKDKYYYLRRTRRDGRFMLSTDLPNLEMKIIGVKMSLSADIEKQALAKNFSSIREILFKNYKEFKEWKENEQRKGLEGH